MVDYIHDIRHITRLLQDDLDLLNESILPKLNSDIPLVKQVCEYIMSSGGKRIRSIIILLLAKALQYEHFFRIDAAIIIEYIHAATLLHDDVIDNSELRRGKIVTNRVFGNSASILVGDFIYTRAFQILTKFNSVQILQVMADTINTITEGEVYQLSFLTTKQEVTERDYFNLIYKKTAKLFEAASSLIAHLAVEANLCAIESISNYGKYFGIAFQIIDDVLDYKPSKLLDKNLGDDLAEAKMTLPLIHTLHLADSSDKDLLSNILESSNRREYLDTVYSLMLKYDSIEYSLTEAEKYTTLAINSLEYLNPSKWKTALIDLINLNLRRNF